MPGDETRPEQCLRVRVEQRGQRRDGAVTKPNSARIPTRLGIAVIRRNFEAFANSPSRISPIRGRTFQLGQPETAPRALDEVIIERYN